MLLRRIVEGGERDCYFSPPIYVFLNLGGGVANKGLFFIEGCGGGGVAGARGAVSVILMKLKGGCKRFEVKHIF